MVDLQTVTEGELLLDGIFNTGFTLLRQVGKITGRLFTTGGVLTKKGREALGLSETAAEKFDIHMLPIQIRDRTIARGFVAVFGNFPFTTGKLKKRARVVDQQVKKELQNLGSRIAPLASFSELSAEVMLKSKRYFRAVSNKFNIAYTRLYERAEQAGVRVAPEFTSQKTRAILETIESAKQVFAKGGDKAKGGAGSVTGQWEKFLKENFIPIERTTIKKGETIVSPLVDEFGNPITSKLPDEPPNIALQDMRQLDGLTQKIDEFISTLDKTSGQDAFIRKQAVQLKLAIYKDMLENVSGKNMGDAQDIVKQFKALDEEFSITMSQIFETATANRFGAVKKGGLGGRGVLREATRQPVDMLAKTVVQLDSPQAVKELRALVGQKTFKRVVAQVINSSVEKAMQTVEGSKGAMKQFNTKSFIKELGITPGFGNRRAAISAMLETADSPFKMKDLDALVTALQKIEDTPIPDVATFVARRAILGGWKSALGAFMASAGTVSALTGNIGSLLLLSTIFVGGSKFFSRMISKPETAKSFMKALDETASTATRRTAYVRAMRLAITDQRNEDPENSDSQMMSNFADMMQELDDAIQWEGEPVTDILSEGIQTLDLTEETPQTIDISEALK
jgi:hypothetical protein